MKDALNSSVNLGDVLGRNLITELLNHIGDMINLKHHSELHNEGGSALSTFNNIRFNDSYIQPDVTWHILDGLSVL